MKLRLSVVSEVTAVDMGTVATRIRDPRSLLASGMGVIETSEDVLIAVITTITPRQSTGTGITTMCSRGTMTITIVATFITFGGECGASNLTSCFCRGRGIQRDAPAF